MLIATASWALDGRNNVFITGIAPGWKTFEIIRGEDSLGELAVEGFDWSVGAFQDWDGVGAYRESDTSLRVFINHENSVSTFTRVDLDVANLLSWIDSGIPNNTNSNQVLPDGSVVKAVSRGWLDVDENSLSVPLRNPCSGNVWMADTFGLGLGFADNLYLLGEETEQPGGSIWVMDLSDRKLYEAVDLGAGRWENACPIDTGRTDTIAIVLSEDRGPWPSDREPYDYESSPLYLYVGMKNPAGNFLERNGLSGGTIYYWDPTSEEGVSYATMDGIFSFGNGARVTGEWVTDLTNAARFSKSEDVHTNMNKDDPGYGREVALACQYEAVFKIDFTNTPFVQGALGAKPMSEITVLFAAEGSGDVFNDMDNLVWSADGKIYVNEDDGEGDVWVLDPAALEAGYAVGDYTPDSTQYANILDAEYILESSGIIDVSEHLGYQAGSIFMTAGQSNSPIVNQLALMVSPQAAPLSSAYSDWAASHPALDTEAKRLDTADPDMDGLLNAVEFALGLSPVQVDRTSPFTFNASASTLSFTPVRSLNVVNYHVQYTHDISLGFTTANSIVVKAGDIDASGMATVALPAGNQLFYRLCVEVY